MQKILNYKLISLVVAILAGYLFSLSFIDQKPLLMFVAMMIMIFLYAQEGAWRVSWALGTFLLVSMGIGLFWLTVLVNEYDGVMRAVAWCVWLGVVLIATLPYMLLFYVGKKITASWNMKAQLLLVFPSLFILSEFLRGYLFTGVPWFRLAHGIADTPLTILMPTMGELGVGVVILFVLSGFYLFLTTRKITTILTMVPALVLWTVLAVMTTSPEDSGKTVNARVVHSHIDHETKTSRAAVVTRVRKLQALSALEPKPELVIWPESTVSIPYNEVRRSVEKGFERLEKKGTTVLFGGYWFDGEKSFNALIDGKKPVYMKKHLVPFGEYQPSWVTYIAGEGLLSRATELSTNDRQLSFSHNGIPTMTTICFELLFGDKQRLIAQDKQLHIHASDLSWLKAPWVADYFLNIARIRAIEHQIPTLYSVSNGISAIIDASGDVKKSYQGEAFRVLDAKIRLKKSNDLFDSTGYDYVILSLLLILVTIYLSNRKGEGR